MQTLQGRLCLLQRLLGVVQGTAVLSGQHEEANGFIAVHRRRVPHGEEIALGLAHLLVVNVQKAIVHPVGDEFAAVGRLGLSDLVLMMGELQVLPAAVDVQCLAQIAVGHGGTLDVPARTALAPGGLPVRLAGLRRLPQGKVHGVFLLLIHIDSGPCLQILQRLMGKAAVMAELFRPVVDISIGFIGIALVHQGLHHVNDGIHVLRGLGVDSSVVDAQRMGVLEILLDILLRHLLRGDALLIGPADNLIIHIGEVLGEGHAVPPVFQIAAQHVKNDDGPRVAHVNKVIHRGAAAVHFHLAGHHGDEFFFFPRHGIEDFHAFASPSLSPQADSPPQPPGAAPTVFSSSVSRFRTWHSSCCTGSDTWIWSIWLA